MNTVRILPKILWRLIVWILPMNLLDGCLNRDPYLKIDDQFTLSAICGSCPKWLVNDNRSHKWDWNNPENNPFKTFEEFQEATHWTLEDVTQYKISDAVIIGDSPEGRFIADRKTGKLQLYSSKSEREHVLRQDYGLDPDKDIHPPSGWMWTQSRFLWPWFVSYYIGCLLLIPFHTIRAARKAPRNQPHELESTG